MQKAYFCTFVLSLVPSFFLLVLSNFAGDFNSGLHFGGKLFGKAFRILGLEEAKVGR